MIERRLWWRENRTPIFQRGLLGELSMFRSIVVWWHLRRLSDGLSETRAKAARMLGRFGDERVVEPLLEAFGKTRHDDVSDACAEALGKLRDGRALKPLVDAALYRGRWSRSAPAARALGELGDTRAIKPLIRLLVDADRQVRDAAAESLDLLGEPKWRGLMRGSHASVLEALGTSGDPRVTEAILKWIKDNEDGRDELSICAAVKALGTLGDDRAVEWLCHISLRGSSRIQEEAISALGRFSHPRAIRALLEAAFSSDVCSEDVRALAIDILARHKSAQVTKQLLQEILRTGDEEGSAALEQMVRHKGRRLTKALLKFLRQGGPELKKVAAKALGEFEVTSAAGLLVQTLDDSDAEVRRTAAMALHRLGQSQWKQWILGDELDFVRLGESGEQEAPELLLKAFERNHGSMAAGCADALGRLEYPPAVEPLIRALDSNHGRNDEIVAPAVACALGQLGDARAIEPLLGVLNDKSCKLRQAAALALGQLGQPQWKEWIKGDDLDFERLGTSGELRALELLVEVLSNPFDPRSKRYVHDRRYVYNRAVVDAERRTAAEAIGQLGDVRGAESLIEVLSESDGELRRIAAEALERLGQPQWKPVICGDEADFERLSEVDDHRVVDVLISAIRWNSGPAETAAVTGLAQIDDPRIVEPLLRILARRPPHWAMKEAASGLIRQKEPRVTSGLLSALRNRKQSHSDRTRIAEVLIDLANTTPRLIGQYWKETRQLVTAPHNDYNEEVSSSDCTHRHVDQGIGLDFPAKPNALESTEGRALQQSDDRHLVVTCPHCSQRIEAAAKWAGRTARCPACNEELAIPDFDGPDGPTDDPSLLDF